MSIVMGEKISLGTSSVYLGHLLTLVDLHIIVVTKIFFGWRITRLSMAGRAAHPCVGWEHHSKDKDK